MTLRGLRCTSKDALVDADMNALRGHRSKGVKRLLQQTLYVKVVL